MKIKKITDVLFMFCLGLSSILFFIFGIEKKFALGIIAFLIPLVVFFFMNIKFRKIRKSFYEAQKEYQEVLRNFYFQDNILNDKIKDLLEKTPSTETKIDLSFYETKKRLDLKYFNHSTEDYNKFLAKHSKFIVKIMTT